MRTKKQIERRLRGVEGFRGCFSSDGVKSLPTLRTGQSYLVHELTDPDQGLGHWIGVKMSPEGDTLYFDSRGFKPYGRVKRSLSAQVKQRNTHILWTSSRVQSIFSDKCGEFAVMFVVLVTGGRDSFREFLNLFRTSEPAANDMVVTDFVKLWNEKRGEGKSE